MANKDQISNKEFADIVRAARGNRSLREYAKDSCISYMTIYKAERGDYLPSSKTIKKMSTGSANPQNGVTYEDMMVAAGYQDKETVSETASVLAQQMIEEAYENGKNGGNIVEGLSRTYSSPVTMHRRPVYAEYYRKVTGTIFTTMFQKNMYFTSKRNYEGEVRNGNHPDITLNVAYGRINEWWFEIKYFHEYNSISMNTNMKILLGDMLFYKTNENIKLSIVVNIEEAYKYLIRKATGMSYRGEFSVILIDTEKQKVVAEQYLSNYYKNDHSAEFFLK